MNEFKDCATMVEEKKIKAKKKRDEVKRLRDEASFKERQERYKIWDEDREIVANMRGRFTNEQITNLDYLQLFLPPYENKEDQDNMIERLKILEKSIENGTMFINYKLEMLGERLDMKDEIRKLWNYIGIMENER